MKCKTAVILCILSGWRCIAESLSICDLPAALPNNTSLAAYSPPICFHYDGLQAGRIYTLKVWLLAPGPWYCASSRWCERTFSIDNTAGTNTTGVIRVIENMDVYNYSLFDWVLRLYSPNNMEVAFTERYVNATPDRAPVL